MKNSIAKNIFEKLLNSADIKINGKRPWDILVYNQKVFERVSYGGSLAIGESFVDRWWDCEKLDQLFARIFESNLNEKLKYRIPFWSSLIMSKKTTLMNKKKSYEVAKIHYDLGNKLFFSMLDKRLNYSCGYWENTDSLDEAQENKLDLICRKLNLKPEMEVLDIGCGWGSFAKFAAERYNVNVLGITISKEQHAFAKDNCKDLNVKIELKDYRDINNKFDRIVSIGMFEHVGLKNYVKFMEIAHNCLKDDGIFLLHTIGRNISSSNVDAWIEKYIFPNSMLPSPSHITTACEKFFVIEDWHNFGQYYDNTLMAWYENFSNSWGNLKEDYDERFFRIWKYYLLSCAGCFRARINQLWQIVFSKKGIKLGYKSLR